MQMVDWFGALMIETPIRHTLPHRQPDIGESTVLHDVAAQLGTGLSAPWPMLHDATMTTRH